MTTKLGLGVPMPLLAPTTGSWAAPFAAAYLFLQGRITYQRLTTKTYLGDTTKGATGGPDPLYLATRAQLNFNENVPLALVLALAAELNGANRTTLNYVLGALFVFRASHAYGISAGDGLGLGRIVGFYGTQSVFVGLTGYLVYLVKDFWQI